MDIKELSIGDWVCYTGKCIDGIGPNRKITYIERDTCGFLIGLDYGAFHYSSAKIEDIAPIPITPEILEENGWMRVGENDYRTVWYRNNIIITFRPSTGAFIVERHQEGHPRLILVRLVIGYLHQLQRALLMCGEEIKIVL